MLQHTQAAMDTNNYANARQRICNIQHNVGNANACAFTCKYSCCQTGHGGREKTSVHTWYARASCDYRDNDMYEKTTIRKRTFTLDARLRHTASKQLTPSGKPTRMCTVATLYHNLYMSSAFAIGWILKLFVCVHFTSTHVNSNV